MSRLPSTRPTAPVTFADLSERQARFVREYIERGGRPGAAADAAVAAGYARPGREGRAAARVRAHELLHNPKVLSLLRDELARRLTANAALGVQTLVDLCQNARSEQVRFSAARELVDRGYGPIVSRSATVRTDLRMEDVLEMLDAKEAAAQAESSVIIADAI